MSANSLVNPSQASLVLGDEPASDPGASAARGGRAKRKREPTLLQPDRFLRLCEVLHLTGFSRSTLYRLMGQGGFPRSVSISTNAVAWLESEVLRWIAGRVELRAQTTNIARR